MGWNPDSAAVKPGPAFRLATEAPPARGNLDAIRETLGRGIWRFDFEPSPDVGFFAQARVAGLPGLAMADVATSDGLTRRTGRHLVGDQFLFNVCLGGSAVVSQCGREAAIGEGDAILSTGSEAATMRFSASRFASFRLPASSLRGSVPDIEDRVARPIARSEASRLLLGYAGAAWTIEASAGELARTAAHHICDLIVLALGAPRAAADAGGRGVRAARLNAIKADIAANLFREDLSAAMLAARHRLTERYLRRLFEEDGATFTAVVLEQRLAHSRRLLANPRRTHQKISAIAAECGFNNLSYFNQSFRRRFGVTPSDMRASAAPNP
jgi:AraC-like DNA-binding protein